MFCGPPHTSFGPFRQVSPPQPFSPEPNLHGFLASSKGSHWGMYIEQQSLKMTTISISVKGFILVTLHLRLKLTWRFCHENGRHCFRGNFWESDEYFCTLELFENALQNFDSVYAIDGYYPKQELYYVSLLQTIKTFDIN